MSYILSMGNRLITIFLDKYFSIYLFNGLSLWSSGQSFGYRSRGPCSIPGATRFPEKQWDLNGVH
jgi:hypothetical protein